MKQKMQDALVISGVISIVLVLLMFLWIVDSYFEAKTYNRVTGKNVSTWDAMWIELRVQSEARD